MDQKLIDLYDEYQHDSLGRRSFIKKLTILAGGTAAANTILTLLENNYALAENVTADEARLETSTITYPTATGEMRARLARPKGDAKLPAVIVIHENRGLNPHIEDVTRRMALAGFLALAPDALSPLGGTPADSDEARTLMRKLDSRSTLDNFLAAVTYLKTHPHSTGKVGAIGFCWGGGMANQLAVNSPDLSAVVPFYGRQPAARDVVKIKASLLLHYAGLDKRINSGIAEFETALKEASVDYTLRMYEGVNHAFHNDTSVARYDFEAAELAWQRTVSFLTDKLKT